MFKKGNLIRKISTQLFLSAVWAIIVTYFHYNVRPVAISDTIHSLIGLALGLLLVFRTNSSYDRFWEGRKLIGTIAGAIKNLIRSVEVFFSQFPEIRQEISVRLLIYNFAVMTNLRSEKGLGKWGKCIDMKDQEEIENSKNPPFTILLQISRIIQKGKNDGKISELAQMKLESHLQTMSESYGGCERILNSPLPKMYVTHLHWALMFYCYSLPFVLLENFHWNGMTVLGTIFLVFVLLGIEEIGLELENPFGLDSDDIPLDDILGSNEVFITDVMNFENSKRTSETLLS